MPDEEGPLQGTVVDTENRPEQRSTRVAAGWITIVGAVGMIVGAGFNVASRADADAALASGDIQAYLQAVQSNRDLVLINLSTWIVAICVLCVGGMLLASASPDGIARRISVFAFTTGAGTAVMFFSLWMAVPLVLAPAAAGAQVELVAHALLAGSVNADWVMTVMIVSVGGGFMVVAGQSTWAPTWLVRWAQLAFAVGAFVPISLVTGLRSLAIIGVPVGIGLMIASGIVAVRSEG